MAWLLKWSRPAVRNKLAAVMVILCMSWFAWCLWLLNPANNCHWGHERGQYNLTVVTSVMDIGRENWATQSTVYRRYLRYAQRVLCLDANLVVFTDARGRPLVDRLRHGRERFTRVVETRLTDLPFYQHKKYVQQIMAAHREDVPVAPLRNFRSSVPEFDILMWSKIYFVHRAIQVDPFAVDRFIWLDGGYTRGNTFSRPDSITIPSSVFHHRDKVSFVHLGSHGILKKEPNSQKIIGPTSAAVGPRTFVRGPASADIGPMAFTTQREELDNVSSRARRKTSSSVLLEGGFFGGSKKALEDLYTRLQKGLMSDWLDGQPVNDEQKMCELIFEQEPTLFHLVPKDMGDGVVILKGEPSGAGWLGLGVLWL